MPLQDYGRYMANAAEFAMMPRNALIESQDRARRNQLMDMRAQQMQSQMDEDAQFDAALKSGDFATAARIDPDTTMQYQRFLEQQALGGLGDIPVQKERMAVPEVPQPLVTQRIPGVGTAVLQGGKLVPGMFRAQPQPQTRAPSEWDTYRSLSPADRELYDQFKGRTKPAADATAPVAAPPDPQAAISRQQDAENVLSSISDAEDMAGFFTTGLVGSVLADVPGTSAYDLRAAVDTIKANIGFDRLTRMREESKTGGALGQVTERELALLQSTIDSLDTGQSEKQLRVALTRVRNQYDRAMQSYERMLQQGAAPTPAGAMPSVESRIQSYYGN